MIALHISETLTLPAEAVTETFAILGKRGSGKTNTAVVFVEELLEAKLPVCVVDPVGVWWGLRAGADGKSPGLPITIIGGEHGDVPLEETAGAAIAEFVVEEHAQVVLDLSLLRKGAQIRFMTSFAETLYTLKAKRRDALHLVIDEADAYAPQRTFEEGAERLLGAMEDLIRRGRSRGIGMTVITQRPAVLNKNVLTQAEVLVVLKLTAPQDQKQIDEWVRAQADDTKRDVVKASLPSLPVGTAWFWSPGWLNVFKKVAVRPRRTFDSSATPKAGHRVTAPRELARVDIDALKKRIAATVEKTKTDDPKVLRARIRDLEHELAAKKTERVEVPVMPDYVMKAIAETMKALSAHQHAMVAALAQFEVDGGKVLATTLPSEPPPRKTNGVLEPKGAEHTHPAYEAPLRAKDDNLKLRAGERRMLEVLARHHPTKLTRAQLGTLVGIVGSGTTFGTYIGVLKRHELVDVAGELIGLTKEGMKIGGGKRAPMTRGEILDIWKEKLRLGERKMLDAVVAEGELTREQLGEIAEIDAKGTTFGTYLGVLKRNDLVVEYGKRVRLGTALAQAVSVNGGR